jgi:hypothetical protein
MIPTGFRDIPHFLVDFLPSSCKAVQAVEVGCVATIFITLKHYRFVTKPEEEASN